MYLKWKGLGLNESKGCGESLVYPARSLLKDLRIIFRLYPFYEQQESYTHRASIRSPALRNALHAVSYFEKLFLLKK